MKRLALAAVLAGLVVMAGCQSLTVVPNYVGAPVQAQPLTTYELVGDATGSASGTIILGLFTIGVDSQYTALPGMAMIPCKIERNALYKAWKNVETADALMCPVFTIDETNYFVFKNKKVDVRVKALKVAAKPVK